VFPLPHVGDVTEVLCFSGGLLGFALWRLAVDDQLAKVAHGDFGVVSAAVAGGDGFHVVIVPQGSI